MVFHLRLRSIFPGKRGYSPAENADFSKDFVTISDERIAAFAEKMTFAGKIPEKFRKKEGKNDH